MYRFENDYNAICHRTVLNKLTDTYDLRMPGYGEDSISKECSDYIRKLCNNESLSVHFLTGGTQSNLIVIAAALKPYQCVIAADSSHIFEHEAGAIESSGHKIVTVPSYAGKITAQQVDAVAHAHYRAAGMSPEHMPQPKLVYISFPTEFGTVYSLEELSALRSVCDEYGLYLYIDGARLGYGLCAADCDVTLADIARLSDGFYIGGTKQGLLYGEAVVLSNPNIATDFRYMMKQRGGMLAKGWLVALQFMALFETEEYFSLARQANGYADRLRSSLQKNNVEIPIFNRTNQVFAILPDKVLDALSETFSFCEWTRIDETKRMVRFCTSWSTKSEEVDLLINELERIL